MRVLAFETSAKAASVALLQDGGLLGEYMQNSGQTHSRTIMQMARDLLCNCDLTAKDVDAVACAAGPGSFTGVRIGLAAAKGFAWGREIPLVGVSTLEAMAWHGLAAGGYVCPVMDARRSQVYNALFEIRDGRPCRLCPDRPIALSELAEDVKKLASPVFLVGDGAAITKDFFDTQGIPCRMAPENLLWQDAWGVAMAAMDKEPGTADDLLPVYLRLSQAERERQARLNAEQHANS